MPEPEAKKPTMREAAAEAEEESKPSKTKAETKAETKVETKETDKKTEGKVEKPEPSKKGVKKDTKLIKKSVEKGEVVSEEVSEDAKPPATDEKPDEGKAPETEKPEDSFASSFDPNNIPEELKPVYKQMQGDYTRKTQSLAKQRETYEKVQRYVPLLNKVLSNPQLLQQVLGIDSKTGKAIEPTDEKIPTDPKEFVKYVSDNTTKRIRAEMAARERIRASQEASMRDFGEAEKIDSRLNDDPNFQNIIIGMVTQNPNFVNRKISAVEATKQAIEIYDKHIAGLIKAKDDERKQTAVKKKHVIQEGRTGGKTVPQETTPSSMREIAKEEGFIS